MSLPKQSMPVKRPDLVDPSSCVDFLDGTPLENVLMIMDLIHGANYNDPAAFANRSYSQVMHSGRGRFV